NRWLLFVKPTGINPLLTPQSTNQVEVLLSSRQKLRIVMILFSSLPIKRRNNNRRPPTRRYAHQPRSALGKQDHAVVTPTSATRRARATQDHRHAIRHVHSHEFAARYECHRFAVWRPEWPAGVSCSGNGPRLQRIQQPQMQQFLSLGGLG